MKHFDLLGMKATDVVTGFKGVVETISFDLYGCVQVVLKPLFVAGGKAEDGRWFDVSRLKVSSKKPVMDVPNFFDGGPVAEGFKGPAEKPLR